MGNRNRGVVTLEIDGEIFQLRFGINECCELEEALGRTIGEIVDDMSDEKKLSVTTLRKMFQIAVSRSRELNIHEVGELIERAEDFGTVMEKLGDAFAAAFPGGDLEDGEDDKDAANPAKGPVTRAGNG